MPVPPLTSRDGQLILDAFTDDDAEAYASLADESVRSQWSNSAPVTPEQARERFASFAEQWDGDRAVLAFAVRRADTRELLGGVTLAQTTGLDTRLVEVWTGKPARGHDVATRAVTTACDWAVDLFAVAHLGLRIRDDNTRSLGLADKLGFEVIDPGILAKPGWAYRGLTSEQWRALRR